MRPGLATMLRQGAANLPLAALLGLGVASVGFLGIACVGPILPDGAAATPEIASNEAESPPLPDPPRFMADAIVARPLFSPTRSPPPLPAPPAVAEASVAFVPPPVEEPVPNYSLRGIVASRVTRKVLLRRNETSKPVWLAEGDRSPEGWVLSRVDADAVLLSKGTREIELRLKPKRAKQSQFAIR